MTNDQKTILSLSKTIADMQEQINDGKDTLELWREERRQRIAAEERIKELKAGFEDTSYMLLCEFNRALEVIRGAGLEFDSPIIASEFQKPASKEVRI